MTVVTRNTATFVQDKAPEKNSQDKCLKTKRERWINRRFTQALVIKKKKKKKKSSPSVIYL